MLRSVAAASMAPLALLPLLPALLLLSSTTLSFGPSSTPPIQSTRRFLLDKKSNCFPSRCPSRENPTTTARHMGIRNFIKKRIGRKGGGGSGENDAPEDDAPEPSTPVAPPVDYSTMYDDLYNGASIPYSEYSAASRASAAADPSSDAEVGKRGGGDRYGESVQDRIKRVKSGFMTEEEKAAFLSTALGSGTLGLPAPGGGTDSKGSKPKRTGSDGGNASAAADSKAPALGSTEWITAVGKQKHVRDGPVPGSSDWIAAVSKGRGGSAAAARDSKEAEATPASRGVGRKVNLDEAAKRAWVDMVTDPDRFHGFSAVEEGRGSRDGGKKRGPPIRQRVAWNEDPVAGGGPAAGGPAAGEDDDSGGSTEEDGAPLSRDLASRLEAAAILQEKKDADNRRAAEEERKAVEREIRAEQRRLENLRLQREEELRLKEKKASEKRRAEEERALKAEEERLEREAQWRKEMEAVQDAYWSKKLEEERQRKIAKMKTEEKEEAQKVQKERAEYAATKEEKQIDQAMELAKIREEERKREDPHEAEILKESAIEQEHDREETWSIMEKSKAEALGQPAPNLTEDDAPDVSASAFVMEQARKKAELDKLLEERRNQLKALNSPIPAPNAVPPAASPGGGGGRSLAGLTGLLGGNGQGKAQSGPTPPSVAPVPAPSPRLSLSEMTRLKKDPPAGDPPASRPPPPPQAKRRGPVRQQLPLVGDEEDDDDYTANKQMSIGEVMKRMKGESVDDDGGENGGDSAKKEAEKKKAMMWGIDMDKFK